MQEDNEEVWAHYNVEEVEGVVQCHACGFWGTMTGYINQPDNKYIRFKCPDCSVVEVVRNPESFN